MELSSPPLFGPHAAPDALYQRAYQFWQAKTRPNADDEGSMIVTLFDFLATTWARRGQADLKNEDTWKNPLFLAFRIRENSPPQVRWLLEARLLADEPLGSMATKLCLSTSTIEWYADAFFDVRSRLRARDFILLNVIGRPENLDAAAFEGWCWKTIGYCGGVYALDDALMGVNPTAVSQYAGQGCPWVASYCHTALQRKAVEALQTLDVKQEGMALELLKLFVRDEGNKRPARRPNGLPDTPLEQRFQAFLRSYPC